MTDRPSTARRLRSCVPAFVLATACAGLAACGSNHVETQAMPVILPDAKAVTPSQIVIRARTFAITVPQKRVDDFAAAARGKYDDPAIMGSPGEAAAAIQDGATAGAATSAALTYMQGQEATLHLAAGADAQAPGAEVTITPRLEKDGRITAAIAATSPGSDAGRGLVTLDQGRAIAFVLTPHRALFDAANPTKYQVVTLVATVGKAGNPTMTYADATAETNQKQEAPKAPAAQTRRTPTPSVAQIARPASPPAPASQPRPPTASMAEKPMDGITLPAARSLRARELFD